MSALPVSEEHAFCECGRPVRWAGKKCVECQRAERIERSTRRISYPLKDGRVIKVEGFMLKIARLFAECGDPTTVARQLKVNGAPEKWQDPEAITLLAEGKDLDHPEFPDLVDDIWMVGAENPKETLVHYATLIVQKAAEAALEHPNKINVLKAMAQLQSIMGIGTLRQVGPNINIDTRQLPPPAPDHQRAIEANSEGFAPPPTGAAVPLEVAEEPIK